MLSAARVTVPLHGLRRWLLCGGACALLAVLAPAPARAALTTFGSTLSRQPTLNTSFDLNYYGIYTSVPPSPEAPNGLYRTYHWATDTALWNVWAAAPESGQAIKVSLEGCAEPAAGGPAPLTQIHFQDVSPLAGGGVKVNLTSQAFDIPVCGENGASASTVSTYEPINLCVSRGDYVTFNDEGGYVPHIYQSGVPYEVMGAASGSVMDSFIRANGTNDGDTLAASDRTPEDGFAENAGEELMMQVTLGTGPDARYVCPGGTKDKPAALAPLHIRPQTDGLNHAGNVAVAIYCRPAGGCSGEMTLGSPSLLSGYRPSRPYAHTRFSLPGNHTGHVEIHLPPRIAALIRHRHGLAALVSVLMGGSTFSETITLKIL